MQTIQVRTLFSTGNGPFSTLLCIGQINILLDCGIDDGLNKTTLSVYDTLPPIHYILLSHGDLKHIGALPYLLSRNPNVEIYATDPVGKIGYLSMLDGMKVQQQQGYPCYKPRELEASYKRVFLLEYYKRQKLEYFEIIALPSGRTLGGSNWRIVKDCDEIVYAVGNDLNNGYVIEGSKVMHVSKPLLMITDAGGIGKCRNQLDDAFKEVIGVIKRRGSVLIPIECSGRLMEYLTMFSTKWNVPGLKDVPIYCISPIQEDLLNANSTIVEWVKGCMDLKMKNVVFYPSYEKIKKDIKNERPFVVFATIQSLAVGTQSRELLKSLNGSDKNGIVFLEPTTNGTIADTLKTTRNILLDVWHTEEFTPEERLQWDEEHNQVIEQSIGEECEMSSEESESDENKALGGSKSTFWQYKTDVFADELDTVGGLFPFNSIRKSTTCYGDISDFKQDTTNKEITLTPDENDEKEIEEIPQKYVMEEQQFIVNMSVAQFDLTGNMETTKIHSIISKILPKNLYFVSHIDSPQWYRDNLPRINLFTRSTDIKEICPVTPTQTVSLSDALLQSLQMYKIDSYKLGSVNGLLQDGELVSINQKERKRQHSVYVGELPIKSLKKLIEDANIDVKIEKGIIICAHGTVTVTKIPSEVPLFTVRGRMNKEFFKIKKIVVDNFSVL